MKPLHLWLDQYGNHVFARTIAELRREAGGGRVSKQYVDLKAGGTLHTGYVIGQRWFTRYARVEVAA